MKQTGVPVTQYILRSNTTKALCQSICDAKHPQINQEIKKTIQIRRNTILDRKLALTLKIYRSVTTCKQRDILCIQEQKRSLDVSFVYLYIHSRFVVLL